MTLKEAELLALKTLKQVMEEKISPINIEIAAVPTETGKYTVYSREEVHSLLDSFFSLLLFIYLLLVSVF